MKVTPKAARILVASDNLRDGALLQHLLEPHFDNVKICTVPERAVQDFEAYLPDVLVLAFDAIEKAQSYCLRLFRLDEPIHDHPHRSVLLCRKDEVPAAFELCKTQSFDDYVLYWPNPHDGLRLPMSIWNACREMMTLHALTPQREELVSHSRHLEALEKQIHHEFASGEAHIAAAQSSLMQLEHEIASASDDLAHRLVRGASDALSESSEKELLSRELERLKDKHISQARLARANGVEPVSVWARNFKAQIETPLAETRALTERIREIHPTVLVVDDDEMTKVLLSQALEGAPYELLFAADGTDALRELRRVRPDAILMDIRLPGFDGVAITRRLKASPQLAGIPVIMMTGDARREALISSMAAGATDFVVKPFTRDGLLAKLEKVLGR